MSEDVWERSMTGAMEQSKGRRAMEHRIIFATSNQGKMREIREILKGLGTEILSMRPASRRTLWRTGIPLRPMRS